MWIRACLNGSRPVGSHPALPLTPGQLGEEGRRAIAAGAVALHIHPRNHEGNESLEAAVIEPALLGLRKACPGVLLEVSTAAWIEADVGRRLAYVRQWSVLPDSAGVNFGEPGAAELARTLLARGIGVEAGLFSAEDARLMVAAGVAQDCNHVQIEPIMTTDIAEALAIAQAIEQVLDDAGVTTRRLLHGKDATCWPLLAYAFSRGYAARIGLEDTLLLPDGQIAGDNAELVQTACDFGEKSTSSTVGKS
jgi:uncharacterized protein (DUF849 family)